MKDKVVNIMYISMDKHQATLPSVIAAAYLSAGCLFIVCRDDCASVTVCVVLCHVFV